MASTCQSIAKNDSKGKLICTYDSINEAISQRNNGRLSILLSKADHEVLAKYNKSDRRTLIWHSVESNNPRALADVILHITKTERIKGDISKIKKCLNRGMQCSLRKRNKENDVFTPLIKSLQLLRKNNNLKNDSSYYSTQCIFILIIGHVEVDCLGLTEPMNDSKNPRDYQIVHPLSIAYHLYLPDIFLCLTLHSQRHVGICEKDIENNKQLKSISDQRALYTQIQIQRLWNLSRDEDDSKDNCNSDINKSRFDVTFDDCGLDCFVAALLHYHLFKETLSDYNIINDKSQSYLNSMMECFDKQNENNQLIDSTSFNCKKDEQNKNNEILQTLFPGAKHGCQNLKEFELTSFLSLILHYKPNAKSTKRFGLSNFIKYFVHLSKIEEIRIKINGFNKNHVGIIQKTNKINTNKITKSAGPDDTKSESGGGHDETAVTSKRIISETERKLPDLNQRVINYKHCANLCSSIGIHCIKWGCLKIIEIRNIGINSDCIDGLCYGITKWGTDNSGAVVNSGHGKRNVKVKVIETIALINTGLDNRCIYKLCNALHVAINRERLIIVKNIDLSMNPFSIGGILSICKLLDYHQQKEKSFQVGITLDRLILSGCVSFKFNTYDFPIKLNLQQNGYLQTFTTVFNDNSDKSNQSSSNKDTDESKESHSSQQVSLISTVRATTTTTTVTTSNTRQHNYNQKIMAARTCNVNDDDSYIVIQYCTQIIEQFRNYFPQKEYIHTKKLIPTIDSRNYVQKQNKFKKLTIKSRRTQSQIINHNKRKKTPKMSPSTAQARARPSGSVRRQQTPTPSHSRNASFSLLSKLPEEPERRFYKYSFNYQGELFRSDAAIKRSLTPDFHVWSSKIGYLQQYYRKHENKLRDSSKLLAELKMDGKIWWNAVKCKNHIESWKVLYGLAECSLDRGLHRSGGVMNAYKSQGKLNLHDSSRSDVSGNDYLVYMIEKKFLLINIESVDRIVINLSDFEHFEIDYCYINCTSPNAIVKLVGSLSDRTANTFKMGDMLLICSKTVQFADSAVIDVPRCWLRASKIIVNPNCELNCITSWIQCDHLDNFGAIVNICHCYIHSLSLSDDDDEKEVSQSTTHVEYASSSVKNHKSGKIVCEGYFECKVAKLQILDTSRIQIGILCNVGVNSICIRPHAVLDVNGAVYVNVELHGTIDGNIKAESILIDSKRDFEINGNLQATRLLAVVAANDVRMGKRAKIALNKCKTSLCDTLNAMEPGFGGPKLELTANNGIIVIKSNNLLCKCDEYGTISNLLPRGTLMIHLLQDSELRNVKIESMNRLWISNKGNSVMSNCKIDGKHGYFDYHSSSLKCTNHSDIEWTTASHNILFDLDEALTVDTTSSIRLDCVDLKWNIHDGAMTVDESSNIIINGQTIEMKVLGNMNVYNMKAAYQSHFSFTNSNGNSTLHDCHFAPSKPVNVQTILFDVGDCSLFNSSITFTDSICNLLDCKGGSLKLMENSEMRVECKNCSIKLNQDLVVDNTSKLALWFDESFAITVENNCILHNSILKYGAKSDDIPNLNSGKNKFNITNNNTATNVTNMSINAGSFYDSQLECDSLVYRGQSLTLCGNSCKFLVGTAAGASNSQADLEVQLSQQLSVENGAQIKFVGNTTQLTAVKNVQITNGSTIEIECSETAIKSEGLNIDGKSNLNVLSFISAEISMDNNVTINDGSQLSIGHCNSLNIECNSLKCSKRSKFDIDSKQTQITLKQDYITTNGCLTQLKCDAVDIQAPNGKIATDGGLTVECQQSVNWCCRELILRSSKISVLSTQSKGTEMIFTVAGKSKFDQVEMKQHFGNTFKLQTYGIEMKSKTWLTIQSKSIQITTVMINKDVSTITNSQQNNIDYQTCIQPDCKDNSDINTSTTTADKNHFKLTDDSKIDLIGSKVIVYDDGDFVIDNNSYFAVYHAESFNFRCTSLKCNQNSGVNVNGAPTELQFSADFVADNRHLVRDVRFDITNDLNASDNSSIQIVADTLFAPKCYNCIIDLSKLHIEAPCVDMRCPGIIVWKESLVSIIKCNNLAIVAPSIDSNRSSLTIDSKIIEIALNESLKMINNVDASNIINNTKNKVNSINCDKITVEIGGNLVLSGLVLQCHCMLWFQADNLMIQSCNVDIGSGYDGMYNSKILVNDTTRLEHSSLKHVSGSEFELKTSNLSISSQSHFQIQSKNNNNSSLKLTVGNQIDIATSSLVIENGSGCISFESGTCLITNSNCVINGLNVILDAARDIVCQKSQVTISKGEELSLRSENMQLENGSRIEINAKILYLMINSDLIIDENDSRGLIECSQMNLLSFGNVQLNKVEIKCCNGNASYRSHNLTVKNSSMMFNNCDMVLFDVDDTGAFSNTTVQQQNGKEFSFNANDLKFESESKLVVHNDGRLNIIVKNEFCLNDRQRKDIVSKAVNIDIGGECTATNLYISAEKSLLYKVSGDDCCFINCDFDALHTKRCDFEVAVARFFNSGIKFGNVANYHGCSLTMVTDEELNDDNSACRRAKWELNNCDRFELTLTESMKTEDASIICTLKDAVIKIGRELDISNWKLNCSGSFDLQCPTMVLNDCKLVFVDTSIVNWSNTSDGTNAGTTSGSAGDVTVISDTNVDAASEDCDSGEKGQVQLQNVSLDCFGEFKVINNSMQIDSCPNINFGHNLSSIEMSDCLILEKCTIKGVNMEFKANNAIQASETRIFWKEKVFLDAENINSNAVTLKGAVLSIQSAKCVVFGGESKINTDSIYVDGNTLQLIENSQCTIDNGDKKYSSENINACDIKLKDSLFVDFESAITINEFGTDTINTKNSIKLVVGNATQIQGTLQRIVQKSLHKNDCTVDLQDAPKPLNESQNVKIKPYQSKCLCGREGHWKYDDAYKMSWTDQPRNRIEERMIEYEVDTNNSSQDITISCDPSIVELILNQRISCAGNCIISASHSNIIIKGEWQIGGNLRIESSPGQRSRTLTTSLKGSIGNGTSERTRYIAGNLHTVDESSETQESIEFTQRESWQWRCHGNAYSMWMSEPDRANLKAKLETDLIEIETEVTSITNSTNDNSNGGWFSGGFSNLKQRLSSMFSSDVYPLSEYTKWVKNDKPTIHDYIDKISGKDDVLFNTVTNIIGNWKSDLQKWYNYVDNQIYDSNDSSIGNQLEMSKKINYLNQRLTEWNESISICQSWKSEFSYKYNNLKNKISSFMNQSVKLPHSDILRSVSECDDFMQLAIKKRKIKIQEYAFEREKHRELYLKTFSNLRKKNETNPNQSIYQAATKCENISSGHCKLMKSMSKHANKMGIFSTMAVEYATQYAVDENDDKKQMDEKPNKFDNARMLSQALYLQNKQNESMSYCKKSIQKINKTVEKLIGEPLSALSKLDNCPQLDEFKKDVKKMAKKYCQAFKKLETERFKHNMQHQLKEKKRKEQNESKLKSLLNIRKKTQKEDAITKKMSELKAKYDAAKKEHTELMSRLNNMEENFGIKADDGLNELIVETQKMACDSMTDVTSTISLQISIETSVTLLDRQMGIKIKIEEHLTQYSCYGPIVHENARLFTSFLYKEYKIEYCSDLKCNGTNKENKMEDFDSRIAPMISKWENKTKRQLTLGEKKRIYDMCVNSHANENSWGTIEDRLKILTQKENENKWKDKMFGKLFVTSVVKIKQDISRSQQMLERRKLQFNYLLNKHCPKQLKLDAVQTNPNEERRIGTQEARRKSQYWVDMMSNYNDIEVSIKQISEMDEKITKCTKNLAITMKTMKERSIKYESQPSISVSSKGYNSNNGKSKYKKGRDDDCGIVKNEIEKEMIALKASLKEFSVKLDSINKKSVSLVKQGLKKMVGSTFLTNLQSELKDNSIAFESLQTATIDQCTSTDGDKALKIICKANFETREKEIDTFKSVSCNYNGNKSLCQTMCRYICNIIKIASIINDCTFISKVIAKFDTSIVLVDLNQECEMINTIAFSIKHFIGNRLFNDLDNIVNHLQQLFNNTNDEKKDCYDRNANVKMIRNNLHVFTQFICEQVMLVTKIKNEVKNLRFNIHQAITKSGINRTSRGNRIRYKQRVIKSIKMEQQEEKEKKQKLFVNICSILRKEVQSVVEIIDETVSLMMSFHNEFVNISERSNIMMNKIKSNKTGKDYWTDFSVCNPLLFKQYIIANMCGSNYNNLQKQKPDKRSTKCNNKTQKKTKSKTKMEMILTTSILESDNNSNAQFEEFCNYFEEMSITNQCVMKELHLNDNKVNKLNIHRMILKSQQFLQFNIASYVVYRQHIQGKSIDNVINIIVDNAFTNYMNEMERKKMVHNMVSSMVVNMIENVIYDRNKPSIVANEIINQIIDNVVKNEQLQRKTKPRAKLSKKTAMKGVAMMTENLMTQSSKTLGNFVSGIKNLTNLAGTSNNKQIASENVKKNKGDKKNKESGNKTNTEENQEKGNDLFSKLTLFGGK